MSDKNLYDKRGVSAHKEEVLAATGKLSKGLYPHAFCKIFPDYLGNDENFVNVMHADGAGTKSILAYLWWKETGDASVWEGIAQDAIVMNLDDLLCAGIYDNIVFNSTIDRNKHLIPGAVLDKIINGSQAFFDQLKQYGINIHYLGGETADVGDVVRTIAVNGTMTCRWPSERLITNDKIRPGQVIVGFASHGTTSYDKIYNSGIGSNGLTSARHDSLSSHYRLHYKESYDPGLDESVVYLGNNKLTDLITISNGDTKEEIPLGKLLLSPTRTYAPVMSELLKSHFDKIKGLVHCSGGGQTKCLKYLPGNFRIIKDNLFNPPAVFELIQKNSGSSMKDMFEVFNMGCRLELYCESQDAAAIINIASKWGVQAQVIGRVKADVKKSLEIRFGEEVIVY